MACSIRWRPDRKDIAEVARDMCAIDAQEIEALNGRPPAEMINLLAENTPHDRIMIVSDSRHDLAVFGLLPLNSWRAAGWGCVKDGFSFQMAKQSSAALKQRIAALKACGVRRVEAHVLENNAKARRFLKMIGGIERPSRESIGRDGERFVYVVKE